MTKIHSSEGKTEKKKITWKKRKVGDGSKTKRKLPKPTPNATTYVKVDGKWVKMNADGTLANETAKETAKPKKISTTTTAVATTAKPTSPSPTTKRSPTTTVATTRRTTALKITKKDANIQAIKRLKKEVEKEMDDFEEYSERVARFMKTL